MTTLRHNPENKQVNTGDVQTSLSDQSLGHGASNARGPRHAETRHALAGVADKVKVTCLNMPTWNMLMIVAKYKDITTE